MDAVERLCQQARVIYKRLHSSPHLATTEELEAFENAIETVEEQRKKLDESTPAPPAWTKCRKLRWGAIGVPCTQVHREASE